MPKHSLFSCIVSCNQSSYKDSALPDQHCRIVVTAQPTCLSSLYGLKMIALCLPATHPVLLFLQSLTPYLQSISLLVLLAVLSHDPTQLLPRLFCRPALLVLALAFLQLSSTPAQIPPVETCKIPLLVQSSSLLSFCVWLRDSLDSPLKFHQMHVCFHSAAATAAQIHLTLFNVCASTGSIVLHFNSVAALGIQSPLQQLHKVSILPGCQSTVHQLAQRRSSRKGSHQIKTSNSFSL